MKIQSTNMSTTLPAGQQLNSKFSIVFSKQDYSDMAIKLSKMH